MSHAHKHLLFVINPIAGGIDKTDLEEQLEVFCRLNHLEKTIYLTTGEDDEGQVAELIDSGKYHAVVAVGGDGTVNLVGVQLISKKIPLGIVPMGSGNGLSKDLKIPQDVDQALDVIADFKVKAIDTLELNGTPSLHLSDVGFNALIVKRFSEGDTRGPAAYAFHVLREYVGYQPKEYEITTDRETYKGKAFMVAIANANMFGSNATINPTGKMDDGLFEICVLEEFPKIEGISILYQLYREEIHTSVRTHIMQCREATLLNLDNELTQIDGEPIDLGARIDIVIKPHSLKVIVPR